jgi:hypothetical protein
VEDTPTYDEEYNGLIFESEIGLTLNCYQPPFHQTRDSEDEEVGNANVELLIYIEGDEDEFQEYIEVWEEKGYRSLDWNLRFYIESGIVTEIFGPIGGLVDNSYRGILPGISFTEPPESEPEELPVELSEFTQRYLAENIERKIIEFVSEIEEYDFGTDDIHVDVDETVTDINIHLPEDIGDEFMEEHNDIITEIIEEMVSHVVEDELDESVEITSIEVSAHFSGPKDREE